MKWNSKCNALSRISPTAMFSLKENLVDLPAASLSEEALRE